MAKIDPSEITPERLFLSRRRFIKGLCTAAAGTALSACGAATATPPAAASPTEVPSTATSPVQETPVWAGDGQDELGNELTAEDSVNEYNNYYEFSISKHDVGFLARNLQTLPWQVEVGGLVSKPKTFDLDELLAFEQQERIYRMRCVEAWGMVVPWVGFPLAELLQVVGPMPEAKYVRLETLHDPEQMPGQKQVFYSWPYVEGLRLDEAMHDLTLLATGIYGKSLLPQTGAPIRLVVPWKYGFKSIKSVVKIELVEEMPTTFWMAQNSREYGFYANVNPDVSHPRWSQASEQRIGKTGRVKTLMFNGYEDQVAHLYEGMDLEKWF